jgi:hypothetical protein
MKMDFKKYSLRFVEKVLYDNGCSFNVMDKNGYLVVYATFGTDVRIDSFEYARKYIIYTVEGIAYGDAYYAGRFDDNDEVPSVMPLHTINVRLHRGITKKELVKRIIFGELY